MPGPLFIAGDTVSLRPIEEEDLAFLKEHVNDPTVWRSIGWPKPTNGPAEQQFFEERVCGDDSINLLFTVDEQPVGTGGFNTLNHELDKRNLATGLGRSTTSRDTGRPLSNCLSSMDLPSATFTASRRRSLISTPPHNACLNRLDSRKKGFTATPTMPRAPIRMSTGTGC